MIQTHKKEHDTYVAKYIRCMVLTQTTGIVLQQMNHKHTHATRTHTPRSTFSTSTSDVLLVIEPKFGYNKDECSGEYKRMYLLPTTCVLCACVFEEQRECEPERESCVLDRDVMAKQCLTYDQTTNKHQTHTHEKHTFWSKPRVNSHIGVLAQRTILCIHNTNWNRQQHNKTHRQYNKQKTNQQTKQNKAQTRNSDVLSQRRNLFE